MEESISVTQYCQLRGGKNEACVVCVNAGRSCIARLLPVHNANVRLAKSSHLHCRGWLLLARQQLLAGVQELK